MNDLLLEMLICNQAGQQNPNVADLMARLRAPGADVGQLTNDVLAQLGDRNPLLSRLLKTWAEAQQPKVIDTIATDETPASTAATFVESAVNELKQQADGMFAELQILRTRIDQLAAALGACCACWGEDPSCRLCRGRGAPGFAFPDEELFEHYVIPTIQLVRRRKPFRNSTLSGNHTNP